VPGGRYLCVILYGIQAPVAVRVLLNHYSALPFTLCVFGLDSAVEQYSEVCRAN